MKQQRKTWRISLNNITLKPTSKQLVSDFNNKYTYTRVTHDAFTHNNRKLEDKAETDRLHQQSYRYAGYNIEDKTHPYSDFLKTKTNMQRVSLA